MVNMGFGFGLDSGTVCFKRKFRWLFKIPGLSEDPSSLEALPPEKGARPSLSFKEIQVEHLNETIYFPSKPDWKPINLVLYDIKRTNNKNPIIKWLENLYKIDNKDATWNVNMSQFKKNCSLEMYDGCGNIIETWIFENCWPNNIEWGELDMSDSGYVTVDLALRYDRAYIVD
jgi:hypothetical protein